MADTEKSDSPKNELQQQNEGLVRETPKRAAKLEIKSLREENSESSENSTDNETDPEPEPQKRKIFHWTDEASKMLVREVNKRKQA